MELSQRDRLSELVEELTTSGQGELNQEKMKEIKKLCKVSNDCIDHVYHSVISQLNQDHSEIRFSAFQIASELFSRSHHFRTLLVDNFQEFLELTVETDLDQPLPPPKEVAKKLKSLAIKTVHSWQTSYGSAYKKLALGYHFLKQVKKVDFQDAEARTVAERRREEERRSRLERIYKEKADAATKDMEDSCKEIEATLTEMESCMKLLFPEFELTNVKEDVPRSSSPNLQLANISDPQPCCSKDLVNGPNQEELVEKQATNEEHNRELGKELQNPDNTSQNEDDDEDEDDEDQESSEEDQPPNEDFIRSSGLISHSYSLDLNLSSGLHVKENEDNEAVVATVRDLHRLITTKHLPAVQGWIQVLTKAGAEQRLLRKALDLKKSLEAALQKHEELHIDYKTRVRKVMKASSDGDEDDDDDFDEVPEKEGYEPHIPEHLRAEYGLDALPSTSSAPVTKPVLAKRPPAPPPPTSSTSSASTFSRKLKRLREEEQDPTSSAATIRLLKDKISLPTDSSSSSEPSTSQSTSSDEKAKDAPVVPFGLDIYYWGQDQPTAGKIIKSASQHQFWVPVEMEEEVENKEMAAESRSRYISFPGRFTPVSHFCRAPLGNGKLCQRQDRVKCPFHGRIIPRDQDGKPCKAEDRQREEQEEMRRRQEQPDWRDPELMRDIEAATGQDLGSDRVGKKGKGKKKKFPNLSDLKQNANTSRSRLEKKVFNKSSMRRVAEVMIKADRRKHDKFSNQFNYALH
ncbi:UV-stimulated scaffold protein A isoform X1 [Periophthalmus magnuspinnatus]|uniref:UV-stimulated scaffold protein A isoform X1 n=1 Tax=Periophthalmus magnuspinnatus TaxID=409849 RepID=UPI00145BE155|nr:UV-stimulated scaffold protein A isoform X1 [Periophthalmus magnuspinnatus]XP_055080583.1 UV-stimulated scaffold protein A isoform X1 [Periophthalmus magnuspinnatus]